MPSLSVNISLYSLAAHFTDYWVIHVKVSKIPKQTNSQKKPTKKLGEWIQMYNHYQDLCFC